MKSARVINFVCTELKSNFQLTVSNVCINPNDENTDSFQNNGLHFHTYMDDHLRRLHCEWVTNYSSTILVYSLQIVLANLWNLLSMWVLIILLLSQRHRVVVPEQPKIRSKGRHSIAFFVHPDNDTPITPIQCPATRTEQDVTDNCIVKNSKSNHTKHKTIYTAYQHLQMRFRETYAS